MKYVLIALLGILLLTGCSVFGIRTTEEPAYRILVEDDEFQVREYADYIVAETVVLGDYKQGTSAGFRRLADYIFGNNRAKQDIKMTAPVLQEKESEKIAMTAPVLQEKSGDSWRMSFVMPVEYTLETLPQPLDTLIKIRTIKGKKVAVTLFSGLLSEHKIQENAKKLMAWVDAKGYQALSSPRSAGYDPPWTIPFLRRNEVHIDIAE